MRRDEEYELLVSRSPISAEDLRVLCSEKGWFTAGTNAQYQKLFDMNAEGRHLEELALVIWVCSDGVTRESVLHTLRERFGGEV